MTPWTPTQQIPVGTLLFILFAIVWLALVIFWIWMLIDAIKNPALDDTQRIIWVLVVILLGWLGAIIYYFAGRQRSTPD